MKQPNLIKQIQLSAIAAILMAVIGGFACGFVAGYAYALHSLLK